MNRTIGTGDRVGKGEEEVREAAGNRTCFTGDQLLVG